jgi:hypothetical protein
VEPAPIFDTGSSLFFESVRVNIKTVESKPFSKDFDKQIKHVDLLQYKESIEAAAQEAGGLFNEAFSNCFEDEERITRIYHVVQSQINKLQSQYNKTSATVIDLDPYK